MIVVRLGVLLVIVLCGEAALAAECAFRARPYTVYSFGADACNPALRLVRDSTQVLRPLRRAAHFPAGNFTCRNANVSGALGLGVARVAIPELDGSDTQKREVFAGPALPDIEDVARIRTLELWFSFNQSLPFGEYVLYDGASPVLRYSKLPSSSGCVNRMFQVKAFPGNLDFFLNVVDLQAAFDIRPDYFERGHDVPLWLTWSVRTTTDPNIIGEFEVATLCFGEVGSLVQHCARMESMLGEISPLHQHTFLPNEQPVVLYYQASFLDPLDEDQIRFLVRHRPFVNLRNDPVSLGATRTSFQVSD